MNEQKLDFLFQRYLHHGQVIRNYAPDTVRGYNDVFKFFLRHTHHEFLDDISHHSMERYLYNGRVNRNWSTVTFRHHFKYFNTFFKWCIEKKLLNQNPLDGIEKPSLEKKLPRRLTREESQLVLDTSFHMPYRHRFERFRNRAIVGLMLFAGLRLKEVVTLKTNHVCLTNNTLFIEQAKGGKDRFIPINSRLRMILDEYWQDRLRLKRENAQFIIGINANRSFGREGVRKVFGRLRVETGLDFTPHTLRHSFAVLMLEGGCDIYALSQMMGHSKITTTTIYLHCSMKQMSKSIELHQLN